MPRCFVCFIEWPFEGPAACPKCGHLPYDSFLEAYPTLKDKLGYYEDDLDHKIQWEAVRDV